MPRTPNPRRVVVKDLRQFKRLISYLIAQWDVPGSVYIDPADRKPGENVWQRKREPAEYPENDRDEWLRLAEAMEEIARAATRLAISARFNAAELTGRKV